MEKWVKLISLYRTKYIGGNNSGRFLTMILFKKRFFRIYKADLIATWSLIFGMRESWEDFSLVKMKYHSLQHMQLVIFLKWYISSTIYVRNYNKRVPERTNTVNEYDIDLVTLYNFWLKYIIRWLVCCGMSSLSKLQPNNNLLPSQENKYKPNTASDLISGLKNIIHLEKYKYSSN